MWKKLLPFRRQARPNTLPSLSRTFRPSLEALEDRFLPSTVNWIAVGDGDFNNAANWQDQATLTNHVPGPTDDAVINTGGVTVSTSASDSVNNLTCNARLSITGGTFSVANAGTNSSLVAQLVLAGGTAFRTTGGTTFLQGGTIAGTLDTTAGATLDFSANETDMLAGSQFLHAGTFRVGGGTVSINADMNAPHTLDLNNGSLIGANVLTVQAGSTLTWSGNSTMGGTGTTVIASGATLALSGPGIKFLSGRTLNNAGAATWSGVGEMEIENSAVLNNSGSFTIQNDQSLITDYGGGTINNSGTWTKTSPVNTGTTTVFATFNNSGTTTVTSGVLSLQGGGTNSASFSVAAGQTFELVNNSYTLSPGATLDGTGTFHVQALVDNVDVTVANVTLDNGSLTGTAQLTVTGSFIWANNCTMGGTGTTVITSTATLTLSGAGIKFLSGRTLNNAGAATWSGVGEMEIENSAVLNNSGSFTIQNDQSLITDYGGGTINNSGTWTKTSPVGTGTTTVFATFNNTGTTTVTSGVLSLQGGGTSNALFSTLAGQFLDFTGGTYTLDTGSNLAGTGTIAVAGASVNINQSVAVANFELDSGTVFGVGTLTVNGTFAWTGGTIANTNGKIVIPVGAALAIEGNGAKSFSSGTILNAGTTTWADSGDISFSNSATFTNQRTGHFTILNDQSLTGDGTFNNSGTLDKASGTATSVFGVTLNNSGKVLVHTSTLQLTGTVRQVTGTTLTGGTWSVFGSRTNISTLTISSAPNLTAIALGASVTLSGVNSSFTNLAGLNSNAGSFSLLGGQSFSASGDFANSGSVTLSPGSVLAVAGSFTQTASGTLNVQIGGSKAKPKWGAITTGAAGTVTLDGGLVVTSTITPAIGQSFTILNNQGAAAISGIFVGLPEGSTITVNGMTFTISYVGGTGNDVTLTRTA